MLPNLKGAKFDISGKMENSANTQKNIYVWEKLCPRRQQILKVIFKVKVKVIQGPHQWSMHAK